MKFMQNLHGTMQNFIAKIVQTTLHILARDDARAPFRQRRDLNQSPQWNYPALTKDFVWSAIKGPFAAMIRIAKILTGKSSMYKPEQPYIFS